MAKEEDKKESTLSTFTVDQTNSDMMEMPSVTRLLNRKKLGLPVTSSKSAPPAAPPRSFKPPVPPPSPPKLPSPQAKPASVPTKAPPPPQAIPQAVPSGSPQLEIVTTEAVHTETKIDLMSAQPEAITPIDAPAIALVPTQEISISPEPAPSIILTQDAAQSSITIDASDINSGGIQLTVDGGTSDTQPTITRSTRRPLRMTTELAVWSPVDVETVAGPLGKPMAALLRQGAASILFLETIPSTDAATLKTPKFVAKAAVGEPSQIALWGGLIWDAAAAPELWTLFAMRPYVEFSPVGLQAPQIPDQNALRLAFGASKADWLTLIRLTVENNCTGIIVVFSPASLKAAMPSIVPLFNVAPVEFAAA